MYIELFLLISARAKHGGLSSRSSSVLCFKSFSTLRIKSSQIRIVTLFFPCSFEIEKQKQKKLYQIVRNVSGGALLSRDAAGSSGAVCGEASMQWMTSRRLKQAALTCVQSLQGQRGCKPACFRLHSPKDSTSTGFNPRKEEKKEEGGNQTGLLLVLAQRGRGRVR